MSAEELFLVFNPNAAVLYGILAVVMIGFTVHVVRQNLDQFVGDTMAKRVLWAPVFAVFLLIVMIAITVGPGLEPSVHVIAALIVSSVGFAVLPIQINFQRS